MRLRWLRAWPYDVVRLDPASTLPGGIADAPETLLRACGIEGLTAFSTNLIWHDGTVCTRAALPIADREGSHLGVIDLNCEEVTRVTFEEQDRRPLRPVEAPGAGRWRSDLGSVQDPLTADVDREQDRTYGRCLMVPHLTKQDLKAIRRRADKATPGPWCVAGSPRDFVIAKHGGSERCSDNPVLWAEDDCLTGSRADAEFVAGARVDIPRLVDEVNRLREILHRVLVWQLGPTFAVDIRAGCPDRDLADEIAAVCSSRGA